jgi:REP element-mobilizing transposase RayT
MARKPRVEVEGGLYHVITRGNDRQNIFHSREDHSKFLALLEKQKIRSAFFLYAYCLMTNHIHLLIERQADSIGSTMQRLLTGYSQYYNRRYGRVGHVFQGRHKAILCQSEAYLTKLVRYIHLNPVRARMVTAAEHYPYSSHRAYLDLEPAGIVDVDPVLRHFGSRREKAIGYFAAYVEARSEDDDEDRYSFAENDILGSEEFVDAAIHRLGEVERLGGRVVKKQVHPLDVEKLIAAVEASFGMSREKFCASSKNSQTIMAKEVLILIGKNAGASISELAQVTALDNSSVSRRYEAAKQRILTDRKLAFAKVLVEKLYSEK